MQTITGYTEASAKAVIEKAITITANVENSGTTLTAKLTFSFIGAYVEPFTIVNTMTCTVAASMHQDNLLKLLEHP